MKTRFAWLQRRSAVNISAASASFLAELEREDRMIRERDERLEQMIGDLMSFADRPEVQEAMAIIMSEEDSHARNP